MDTQIKAIEKRISLLEAENKELRRLWIETEGDIIELRTHLDKQLADIQLNKEDRKVKVLTKLIMHVHRLNGGTIKERK